MIGVDTTVLIDLYKGNEEIKKLLDEIEDDIALNIVTYLELMLGLNFKIQKHKNEENYYDSLFNSYLVLKLDYSSCKKNSEITRELKLTGDIIDPFDCTIAAIYLANGVDTVITRNVKHFEKIKGLKIITY